MRIGWVEDPAAMVGYKGGAELDSEALRASSPHEVVLMAPGGVERGMDAYVVSNCIFYTLADFERLDAPIVKVVNDAWKYGLSDVRNWLLYNAEAVVLRSPLHRERFTHPIRGRIELLPSWVDLERFSRAQAHRRERVVWLANVGSPERLSGLQAVMRWATRRGLEVDAYGIGAKKGPVPYADTPRLLAGYRYYGHAMGLGEYEPFGRATVEAWAAGCELVVSEEVGALHWISEAPEKLSTATEDFWMLVEEVACVAA